MLTWSLKPILALLFITLNISPSLQTPLAQNYTENLLRVAKSAEINAFIRKSEHQCDNFYREVCGNWKLTYPATHVKPKTAFLDQFYMFYRSKCLDLMKGGVYGRNYHKMLMNFFQSCTIEKHHVKRGLESVLDNVLNFHGGWPQISKPEWYLDDTKYDRLEVIANARRKLGVNIFIGLDIVPDLVAGSLPRIKIGAPKLPLGGRNIYLDEAFESNRDEYKQLIAKKLRDQYPNMPTNWADEVASQVLDVEQKLAKGLDANDNLPLREITREVTVGQLNAAYGNYIVLERYLRPIFNRTISEKVYESPLNYMANLVDVIKNTPKLIIANYTAWRVLESLDFAGGQNEQDNDVYCLEKTMHYFPKHVEDLYEQSYDSIQFFNSLNEVFENIKSVFTNELAGVNWMSVRQKGLEKLREMKLDRVHHYYGKLEEEVAELLPYINSDNYYTNMLKILEWQTKQGLQRPQLPTEPPRILPNYIHTENKIQIPVMFMQPRVLWDPVYPNALKYSTIGVLLAQQMLRGFIGTGSEYDKRGDPNPWWNKETEVAYKELAECFEKQYTKYKFEGKPVNDPKATSQGIIDAGALKIAYHTYHDWMNNMRADVLAKESLPNVDYKPHEFFFLGYGQMYCADYYFLADKFTQLPERVRVNGAIANLEEFGKVFNCQQNTNMNPINKCALF